MAAKVAKLDEQFRFDCPREKQKDGSCSNIFGGVSIYVNGYTGKTRSFGLLLIQFVSLKNKKKNEEKKSEIEDKVTAAL